jgi:hypothetical protein
MNPAILETAIYSVLHGDATLLGLLPGGVWSSRPPAKTLFPYLRFRLNASPEEVWTMGGGRIARFRYQVSVGDKGNSKAAAYAALARADVLLSNGTFSPTSGTVLYCRREGYAPETPEEVDGIPYQMVHATYRIDATP